MRAQHVSALSVRSFRNIAQADVSLGPRFNVVSGDNGQGKTSLLEAVYVALTSRSFRATKIEESIAFGATQALVRARIDSDDGARWQSVGLRRGGRDLRLDDKRPRSSSEFATRAPVVVFHPGEISLSAGSGAERRRLLDRVALFSSPSAGDELARYTRAVRSRQAALESRGAGSSDLGEWEELSAVHGARVVEARRRALAALAEVAQSTFGELLPEVRFDLVYSATAPSEVADFASELRRSRSIDVRRGSASIGPHRDDLRLELGGKASRRTASQGQHRAIVLSLKMAELAAVGALSSLRPVLLLDDVSSELDRARSTALFSLLSRASGQVLLSTTRPEIIETTGDRVDFVVRAGAISPL